MCTFRPMSLLDRYGDLKGFRLSFPCDMLLTFRQSNHLSNFSTNQAVSSGALPPLSCSALATELLSTYRGTEEGENEKNYFFGLKKKTVSIKIPVLLDPPSYLNICRSRYAQNQAWATEQDQL